MIWRLLDWDDKSRDVDAMGVVRLKMRSWLRDSVRRMFGREKGRMGWVKRGLYVWATVVRSEAIWNDDADDDGGGKLLHV